MNEIETHSEFQKIAEQYADTEDFHHELWIDFYKKTQSDPLLKRHRDYVVVSDSGYGNRPLQYMWKVLIDVVPLDFSFLEIGVFRGQITSLVQLLADRSGRATRVVGVTPWTMLKEQKSQRKFYELYQNLNVSLANTLILDGSSDDKHIEKIVSFIGPFDIVYIDGDHSYEMAKHDIFTYGNLVKIGGYIVVDDCSNFLHLPAAYLIASDVISSTDIDYLGDNSQGRKRLTQRQDTSWERIVFRGIVDVSEAVRDTLDNDPRFQERLAVGHNRIWQRVR